MDHRGEEGNLVTSVPSVGEGVFTNVRLLLSGFLKRFEPMMGTF